MVQQEGGAQAIINVPRDDGLQVHPLLGLRKLRVAISVLGRNAPVLTGGGLRAGGCGLLTVAKRIPEQATFRHALVQLLQPCESQVLVQHMEMIRQTCSFAVQTQIDKRAPLNRR